MIDKTITSNGVYNPIDDNTDAYRNVVVSVPNPGYVMQKSISINGEYDASNDNVDGYDKLIVNVSHKVNLAPMPSVISTNNSTYYAASDSLDGYTVVSVNVSFQIGSSAFSDNDTYYASDYGYLGYDTVTVSVAPYSISETYDISSNGVFTPGSQYDAFGHVNVYVPSDNYENYLADDLWSYVNIKNIPFVKSYCFYGASITGLVISNVSTINERAFAKCASLVTVSLYNVSTVGTSAFYSCMSLTTVHIYNTGSSASLGKTMFYHCSSLRSVYISASMVIKCGTSAFAYTPMINSTYLSYYGSIYVPASLVNAYKTATNWSKYSSRITSL